MDWLVAHGWILLAVVAQFTWATGNYLDRYLLVRFRSNEEAVEVSGVGTLLLVSSFFAVIVALTLFATVSAAKSFGYLSTATFALPSEMIAKAILVGVLEVVWLIPYFYALDESDETEAAPLLQSVPIFGLILGLTFFNETPIILHIVGSGIIITGALILNLNFKKTGINIKVIMLMLLASFIIAIATFIFKGTALEENYWGAAFWMSIGMVCTGQIILLLIKPYRQQFLQFLSRKDWRGFGLSGINETFDQVAILTFYAAIMLGPSVMTVQATTAYQPVIVLIIGLILAKFGSNFHQERFLGHEQTKKILGVLIICVGSVLIFQ